MAVSKNSRSKNSNVKKKLKVRVEPSAVVHIKTSFNNLIMSMANKSGEVITWSSAGKMKFKGARKNTPYAAKCVAEDCCERAHSLGIRHVDVFINGPGTGREAAVRSIETCGILVNSITDNTKLPFNGCRPPKRRRP